MTCLVHASRSWPTAEGRHDLGVQAGPAKLDPGRAAALEVCAVDDVRYPALVEGTPSALSLA